VSLNTGHYVAYTHDQISNTWFLHDDESVRRLEGIENDHAFQNMAMSGYLFLYEQSDSLDLALAPFDPVSNVRQSSEAPRPVITQGEVETGNILMLWLYALVSYFLSFFSS
jgi:hypothetical protein